jgi:hypothetical protein
MANKMIEQIQETLINVDRALAAGVIANGTRSRFAEFLRSVRTQITQGRKISPGQRKYLGDIQTQCDETEIAAAAAWINDYSDDLREIAIICANYYESAPDSSNYFSEIRANVFANPSQHILSKREFTKMCMNKYTEKVVESTLSEPKFSKGQFITVRSSNRLDMTPLETRTEMKRYYDLHRKAARGESVTGMVVAVNAVPVYRAAKDSKVYKVLPVGDTRPFLIVERDMKKYKKSKVGK